jgi:hypothetical protein
MGLLFVIITVRHLSFPFAMIAQETFDRRQASLRARALGSKSSLSLEDRVDKHVQAMDHVLQLFLIDELLYQSQHLQVHLRVFFQLDWPRFAPNTISMLRMFVVCVEYLFYKRTETRATLRPLQEFLKPDSKEQKEREAARLAQIKQYVTYTRRSAFI